MGKSFLKFRLIRSLCRNLWPTRSLTPKQRFTLSKLKKKKLSPFGVEMMERRKISALYGGISRTYEKKLIKKAKIYPGKLGYNFLLFLEQRLDSIVFRMNICSTFSCSSTISSSSKSICESSMCKYSKLSSSTWRFDSYSSS
jgi:ribosomal protein S4